MLSEKVIKHIDIKNFSAEKQWLKGSIGVLNNE